MPASPIRRLLAAALLAGSIPALAQDGFEEAPGADPVARIDAAIASRSDELGAPQRIGAAPRPTGGKMALTMAATRFARDPDHIHLFVATALPGVCHRAMPAAGFGKPVLEAAAAECINAFTARARQARGGGGAGGATAPTPAAVAAPGATLGPPRHADNWQKVSAVLFRATYMVGVGGMTYPDFEPVVLFKDGTYMEVQDAALEDTDLVASRAAKPKRWGRWVAAAGGYTLTGSTGKPETMKLQDGSLFKAFGASGRMLSVPYKRISGGGNSALGGEMTIASSSQYAFMPDGRFSRDGSFGAIGSGQTSGVGMAASSRNRQAAPGRYTLKDHTLTLTFPDGRQKRHFFAFGSKKAPAQLDTEMIFIDGSVYSHID